MQSLIDWLKGAINQVYKDNGIWPTLAVVVLVFVLVALGMWLYVDVLGLTQ